MFRSAPRHLFRWSETIERLRYALCRKRRYAYLNRPYHCYDFLVARARRDGDSFVLILEKQLFSDDRLGGASLRTHASLELAVNLDLTPMEAELISTKIITLDQALAILLAMGHDLPGKLPDNNALFDALGDSVQLLPPGQIDDFSLSAMRLP